MSLLQEYRLTSRFYADDHLYSPAALTTWTGALVERYEYDAYGSPYILEPNFAADPDGKSDYGNPYLFTGRRVDFLDNGSLTNTTATATTTTTPEDGLRRTHWASMPDAQAKVYQSVCRDA
jgi:hypothetical protein